MGKYNKLSEKDELIKSLREKQHNNPKLKKAINEKIDAIESDKTVTK